MKLAQLTPSDLDHLSEANKERIEAKSLQLKKLHASQERLRLKAQSLQQELIRADSLEASIRELRIILQGIPDEVAALRKEFVEARVRSRDIDVTVRQAQEATQKSLEIRKELTQICTHTLIVHQPEDPGSYSEDYSDSRPEYRRCLICGLQESGPKFNGLTNKDDRLLRYHYHAGNYQFFDSRVFPEEPEELLNLFLSRPLKDILEQMSG